MSKWTFCLEAQIETTEDGTVICPILETGGSCEECVEILERRMERDG